MRYAFEEKLFFSVTIILWKKIILSCLKGQFHIKSSRSWHPYFSEFLHFCTICRYQWNMRTLKISAPNSLWFLIYRYLKIWAIYLIGTKICHFEFTLSLITSGLKDLSSWNLVQVKNHEKSKNYTKNIKKQTSAQLFHIWRSCYAWLPSWKNQPMFNWY